mmetsp:Transcript_47535/g.152321  ORF Transcript_47535/g.152321 Transcript_47535/m.152321 type:complete len:183 (-) Transcript_47535:63-611(-)
MHAAPPLSRGLPSRAGLTSRAGPPSRTPEVLRCPPGRRRHTSRLPVGGPLTHPPVRRRYKVLRGKGTEPARSGEYDKFYPKTGYFVCKACKHPLYSAGAKFDSGCGWPAFDKCFENALVTKTDESYGMKRVEIMCGSCGGHLGHVFEGERMTDTNERHCVNSVSVKFVNEDVPAGLKEAKVV